MSWNIVVTVALITGSLFSYGQTSESINLVKEIVCRINVTSISEIDEDVLMNAFENMDKDIKTCPLEKELKWIENFLKKLEKMDLPADATFIEKIDSVLYKLLTSKEIKELKNATDGDIQLILGKIINYYETNPKASFTNILGGFLCQIKKMDITNLKMDKILEMIKNFDKTQCSKDEQKAILEEFVKMFRVSQWFNPDQILKFLRSDMFKSLLKALDIPSNFMPLIINFVDNINIIEWSVSEFGERFLCNFQPKALDEINDSTFLDALMGMVNKENCPKKIKTLVDFYAEQISGYFFHVVDQMEEIHKNFSRSMMDGIKPVDWTMIRNMIGDQINQINGIVDMIFKNVKQSKNREWTVESLMKNVFCGLDLINTFKNMTDNTLEQLLPKIGNLNLCNEKQEEDYWEKLWRLQEESLKYLDSLSAKSGGVNVSDILPYIPEREINILSTFFQIMNMKELDNVVRSVLKNLNVNKNLKISVDYPMKFLACNLNLKEGIFQMDLKQLMNLLSKFGQPVTCKVEDILQFTKALEKVEFKMYNNIVGKFKTQDLKDIVMKVEKLKNIAMASFNKVYATSEDWITYVNRNGSTFNITAIAQHFMCFGRKVNFTSIETVITSLGEFGKCSETELKAATSAFWKLLESSLPEGEKIKNLIMAMGFFNNGKVVASSVKDLYFKLFSYDYFVKLWAMVPTELKELSVGKVLRMIGKEMSFLDNISTCVVKSIVWPLFGQPKSPDFWGCFGALTPSENKPKPGKIPGGKIKDRYKIGDDFHFDKLMKTASPDDLLKALWGFSREPNTEKEERILNFVTKKSFAYLLANSEKLQNHMKEDKKRLLELASKVGKEAQVLSQTKIDSNTLSMIEKLPNPQQTKRLLRKAMKDMKVESVSAKKDFIQKISTDMLKDSGIEMLDKLFSEETKKDLLEKISAKRAAKSKTDTNQNYRVVDEKKSLAELALVNKMKTKSDLVLMMDTTLVSAISIDDLKKIPKQEMCAMKAATTELKEDQVRLLIDSCPKAIEKIAQSNPSGLGKIAAKVSKKIVNSLNLKELVNLTIEACRYERKFDVDLEKSFKDWFINQKIDLTKNGSSMSCVLKQVKDLKFPDPEGIELCKTLGKSLMNKILPKHAEIFKNKCLELLKKNNISFYDMGSLNAYLKQADVTGLNPEIVLEGAQILSLYVFDSLVFNAIGGRIAQLKGFEDRSKLTDDQVSQVGIFISSWTDANKIPKASIPESFQNIANSVSLLQKKKLQCLRNGREKSQCEAMDAIIDKTIQLLLDATVGTTSRRKRSTKVSCQCANLISLGLAAVQVSATKMSEMICDANFNECMEGLSQVYDWNQEHRKVFVDKSLKVWGEPAKWNATHMTIASAIIPGLSTSQINVLPLNSMDDTFYLGKQNNWENEKLTQVFVLFVKNLKSNNVSSLTSFDLQALGNIVCGISVENIDKISDLSYINAASQIGSLDICSEAQLTAWANKALAIYGTDVTKWNMAEIASIGSVISGFSDANLQKLNQNQIGAITLDTIPKILPKKLANLHPSQMEYLTTSQAQMITSAQRNEMSDEQRNILKAKLEGSVINNGQGGTINGLCYHKWSMLFIVFINALNFLSRL